MFERVLEKEKVDIAEIQYGLMPGRGTTDTIFILRQLQERFLHKKLTIVLCLCELGKGIR